MTEVEAYAKKELIVSGALLLDIISVLGEQPYHRVAPLLAEIGNLEKRGIFDTQDRTLGVTMETTNPSGVANNGTDLESAVDQIFSKHSKPEGPQEEETTEAASDQDLESQDIEDSELDTEDDTEAQEDDVEDEEETEEESEEPDSYVLEVGDRKLELNEQDINGLLELREQDIPFSDLKSNVMMQRAFTQKTQELAESKREQVEQFNSKMAELAETFEIAETVVLGDLKKYEKTNWKKLKEEDPYAFEEAFVEYQAASERYEMLQSSIKDASTEYQKNQSAKQQELLQHEIALLQEKMPEAKSPKTWEPVQKQMSEYLSGIGFDRQTLDTITDHRYMQIIRDASEYAKVKRGVQPTKKKVSNVKVLKAGQPKSKKQQSQQARKVMLDEAFSRGDTDSAVDAIANLIRKRR